MRPFFDAHLDLAYLELNGRDMSAPLADAKGEPQPPAVTLRSLQDGQVRWAFTTIYSAPSPSVEEPNRPLGPDPSEGPGGYEAGDRDAARSQAVRQLEIYRRWEDEGLIQIVRSLSDLDQPQAPLQAILLMEGADPIRSPEDVTWWHRQGLRVVGLSWWRGTTYAGGNGNHYHLTDEGKEMVSSLDEAGMIHDLSHLSDESAEDLISLAKNPIVASHSNSRTLMDGKNHRHLSDELIGEIGRAGGVIGVNLASKFLTMQPRPATLAETLDHVERIAESAGGKDRVGLGSDMDGGFGADELPDGINEPAGLQLLLDGLEARGWTPDELDGFAHSNWLRLIRDHWSA